MRILCAIGPRRGVEVVQQAVKIARTADELILVHVIDIGPRHDLDRIRGPMHPHHEHGHELDVAETGAAETVLKEAHEEAARVGFVALERLERGRPEDIIVSLAGELDAAIVVLCARDSPLSHPRSGPPSVGHTARFVLDHAPSHVLLLRETQALLQSL